MIQDLRRGEMKDQKLMKKLDDIEKMVKKQPKSGSAMLNKLNDLYNYLENIQKHYGNDPVKMNQDPWTMAPFASLGQKVNVFMILIWLLYTIRAQFI